MISWGQCVLSQLGGYCSINFLGMTQEFVDFHLLLGAGWGWGCGCSAACWAGAGPRFRCVFLCLQIIMKLKILNSIKTGIPKAYVESLFDMQLASLPNYMQMMFLTARGGLYSFNLIPTLDTNSRSQSVHSG